MKLFKLTILVAIISLLGRVVGFIREALLAQKFGVSETADAIFIALTFPIFFQFVIGAAVASVLIPILSEITEKHDEYKAIKVFNSIFLTFIILITAIIICLLFISDKLVFFIAPDISQETYQLAKKLTVYLLPLGILTASSMLLNNTLQFKRKFFVTSFAPVVMNIVVILAIILLFEKFGIGSFIIGIVLGAIFAFLFQLWAIYKVNFKLSFPIEVDGYTKRAYELSFSVMLGLFMNQLYLISNRIMAAPLEVGSISALSYSEKIMQLPLGVFAQSLGIVMFPVLATLAAKGEIAKLTEIILRCINIVFLISIPFIVIFLLYSVEIVSILFQRGQFNNEAVILTADALKMFSLNLLAQGLIMMLTRVYYSLQKPRVPMITVTISAVINIVLSFFLRDLYGHSGIALANSISASINVVLLILYLRNVNIPIFEKVFFKNFAKYCFVFIITMVLGKIFSKLILINNNMFELFIQISSLFFCYIIILIIFRDKEILHLYRYLLKNKNF